MYKRSSAMIAVGCAVATLAAGRARADLYGFHNITHNSAVNEAIGEAQLRVDVNDAGSGQVSFTFLNLGPYASSITDVYFDDSNNDNNPLATLASITNGPGVNFSMGANPSNLPGGYGIWPRFRANFGADSNSPTQPNGVNPNEMLMLTFNLANGITFADLIDELDEATLRIGIHVQGFDHGCNDGSESFINDPKPVPTPGALILAVVGFGLVIRMRKHWTARP